MLEADEESGQNVQGWKVVEVVAKASHKNNEENHSKPM